MILSVSSTADLLYKSALFLSFILLFITSWFAPMSGDEYVHVKQAENNIKYLTTLGQDIEALNTPISRLKHYGQSFDTVTTFVALVFSIDDLYRFRHVSNAIIAWLTILFTSLITIKITKSQVAGFLSVILFLVSLRFMGHAMNNLKDIPFAFAFIFSLYFNIRFLEKLPKISWIDLGLMTQGLALGISIRIGGLLIFAYYLLFTFLYLYFQLVSGELQLKNAVKNSIKVGLLLITVFVLAYFNAILIWPWALENPIKNPWISLDLMHHYPTTIRQIFDGQLYWSDQFPWYYLVKYLLITLPIIVLIGFGCSLYFVFKLKNGKSVLFSIFALIACGFPLFYASVSGANVYGGWRQLLFVFPPLIVLSSIGLWQVFDRIKGNTILKVIGTGIALILLIGPIRYFVTSYPYQYTFFNSIVGGVEGAYGNYEIDYYFTSYKKAYEFIDQQSDQPKIVAANFIIPEYYEGKKYTSRLIDYYSRSSTDWDYAIICNTFLDPHQLRNGFWPPSNAMYIEKVEGKPILAILKRKSKIDLEGKTMLDIGNYSGAIKNLELSLINEPDNESIRLNLARAYLLSGDFSAVQEVLKHFEKLYPSNEWAREIRGEVAMVTGKTEEAIQLFRENVNYNYKFFHSYISLAKAYVSQEKQDEAIRQLKACLHINPFYMPAYKLYGELLIEQGDVELGRKMIEYSIEGNGKYGGK